MSADPLPGWRSPTASKLPEPPIDRSRSATRARRQGTDQEGRYAEQPDDLPAAAQVEVEGGEHTQDHDADEDVRAAAQGRPVELQHLRPRRLVQPVRAVVHLEALEVERARQSAHLRGRLEHHHPLPRPDERMRRGQSRGPRADDHRRAHPVPPTAGSSSAASVLGARPARSQPMPRATVRPISHVSRTGRHFERPTRAW